LAKDAGKKFEEDFKASIPPDFYVERYKDDTAGFKGVANPADYRLYKYPYTFLLELKSHKGKSLPLAKIRDAQIKGLAKAVQHRGIYGGFIINYRDLEETYYVPVMAVIEFIYAKKRKSIPVEWCREQGELISQKKKVTRYAYGTDKWLGGYYEQR
jgi:recombination protein U